MESPPSPEGRPAVAAARARRAAGDEYRRVHAELAAFERLARVVLARRTELEVTQGELAERMGTTASAISRIESGQHATSIATLTRLAAALDAVAVVGLRFEDGDERPDELVAFGSDPGS